MTIQCVYFSPTTPGAASFALDVTSAIRLGSLNGLSGEAELGAVGSGSVVFDDPTGTFGYLSDGIVGLKQMYFNEFDCPIGNQRLWTGYVADRRYHRGQSDSLITGAARKIDVTLLDVNAFLSFRVFPPTADDPTSDFNRPAETDIQRITALLTTVDFLSTTLFDDGYINTAGPVNLDANDYTGAHPQDVLNDCAQMSGKNYFVRFNETTGHYMLWYDKWTSDGSATIPFDSTLRLTNVLSEVDATTLAIMPDAVEVLDPSRVISSVYVNGNGVTTYDTLPTTAYTYAWRDATPISSSVKTSAKAHALGQRYLAENSTEDARIICTVQVPSSQVTLIQEGMRIQVHFTHLPIVNSGFAWTRIVQRTIRQDQETPKFYWLDLELSPLPPIVDYAVAAFIASQVPSGGPVWPAGWIEDFTYVATHGFYGDQRIYLAHGPTAGSVTVTNGGGGTLGHSVALIVIEVLQTTDVSPAVVGGYTQEGTDTGGPSIVYPDTTVSDSSLLLAFVSVMTSAVPRNDPAPGWDPAMQANGTSTTTDTLCVASTHTYTTQAGLDWVAGDVIRVASTVDPQDYVMSTVNSYSGTTLVIDAPYRCGTDGGHSISRNSWQFWKGNDLFALSSVGDRELVAAFARAVAAGTWSGVQTPQGTESGNTAIAVVAAYSGVNVSVGRTGIDVSLNGVANSLTAVLS